MNSLNIAFRDIIKLFFKKWYFHLISWIVPLILGIIFLYVYGFEYTSFAFYGLPIITTTFIAVPVLINQIKKSNQFAFKYKNQLVSWQLTFAIAIFFFCYLIILAVLFILTLTILFAFWFNIKYTNTISLSEYYWNIKFVNWVEMLFYIGYGAILGLAFSFFINTLIKNNIALFLTCIAISLFLFAFSGLIPYPIIFNSNVGKAFGYLSILRYINVNGYLSSLGIPVFCFKADYTFNLFNIDHIDVLMNFIIPFICIGIFISVSAIKFRWFDKDVRIIQINDQTKSFPKHSFIIIYSVIAFFSCLLIIGLVLVILANYYHGVNFPLVLNSYPQYVIGSLFLMLSIIGFSICGSLLARNIYVNKLIQVAKEKQIKT